MDRVPIAFALLVTGVIITGVVFLAPVGGNWLGEHPIANTPQFTAQMSFDDANETVLLTHGGGDALREGIEVRVLICPAGSQTPVNATLMHNETTVTNGLWVSSERRAAASHPLRLGDSVEVVSDGVNSNSNGRAGIESGDTLVVNIVNAGADHKAQSIVLNETVGSESGRPCLLD